MSGPAQMDISGLLAIVIGLSPDLGGDLREDADKCKGSHARQGYEGGCHEARGLVGQ